MANGQTVEQAAAQAAALAVTPDAVKEFERLLRKERVERTPVPMVDGKLVPGDIDGIQRMAGMIAQAGMVPESLWDFEKINGVDTAVRVNMPKVCVAIAMGMEAGLSAMMSVRWVMVVNGVGAIWGDGAMALVRGSGKLAGYQQTIEGLDDREQLTMDSVAVCRVKRAGEETGTASGWHEYRFSVRDAIKAGLIKVGDGGALIGRNVWRDFPKRMIEMRPRGFALRDIFADVLCGLSIAESAPGGVPVLVDGPVEDFVAAERQVATQPERQPSATERLAALAEDHQNGNGGAEAAVDGDAEPEEPDKPAEPETKPQPQEDAADPDPEPKAEKPKPETNASRVRRQRKANGDGAED